MKTKKSPTRIPTSKLVASHALVAGFFTAPWIVFAYNDIFTILTAKDSPADQEVLISNLVLSLSTLSSALFVVAIVSFGYYLLKKAK